MNRYFLPFLVALPSAMVCTAEQVPSAIEAQVAVLQQVPSMSTADAVDAILAMEAPQGGSPGYRESLKSLKTVAILAACLTTEDAEKKELYMTRCREDYPGVWIMLHLSTPELMSTPEQQKKLADYVAQLSPEQLRQNPGLTGLRCGMMVAREGKQLSPEKRKEIVLKTLNGYGDVPSAQAILAVHYLYPEYKMQDAAAAQECLLTGAQVRCTPIQLFNESKGDAFSMLVSIAYAAAQQKGVDTLPLQFGALSLAILLDENKPWPRYRMGQLWSEYASHPVMAAFNPEAQAFNMFESAARTGHAPSLYALGKMLCEPELMEQAVAMGYDETKDYNHVSPGASVNYNCLVRTYSYLPSAAERAFSRESFVAGIHLIQQMTEFCQQHEDSSNAILLGIQRVLQQISINTDDVDADCLYATDAELLESELKGFRHMLKLREGQPYELYKLYRDGSDPTGAGKDAALAEQYLRRAAIEEAHPQALLEFAEQAGADVSDPLKTILAGVDAQADELLVCFMKMTDAPLDNILPLDDALQAWAAKHPQQRKLAESLRIHCLLFVHNEGWKTSPENNAVTREVRKRLLQIIRNVPADVLNADSKEYLQQIFETQDAAEARDLRRWYAARNITPPASESL